MDTVFAGLIICEFVNDKTTINEKTYAENWL